jgi:hypothetical protein
MPNKIESNMTPEQLAEFCKRLGSCAKPTLAKIQDLAGEFGVEISLMAAKSFRESNFADYLEELRRKRDMAEAVSTAAKSGLSLTDAAASVLSSKVFDRLMSAGTMEDDEMDQLSLALSRLRLGDQRASLLAARLREYEAKEAERAEKKATLEKTLANAGSKGGITADTLDEVRRQLKLM